jgi:hypothetical protein
MNGEAEAFIIQYLTGRSQENLAGPAAEFPQPKKAAQAPVEKYRSHLLSCAPLPCGQIFVWMGVIELPICQMRLRAQLVAWRGRLFAFPVVTIETGGLSTC